MSTFFFKVMNLVVRTIAKPLISWVTHYKKLKFKEESQSKVQNYIRKKLIWTGQTWNHYNILLNRKLFKISTGSTTIAVLTEDKALEKGAEFLSEVLVYTILLIVPILELIRLSKITKKKELEKENYLNQTKELLDKVKNESIELEKEINKLALTISQIENKLL
jgi:hypothetical protein